MKRTSNKIQTCLLGSMKVVFPALLICLPSVCAFAQTTEEVMKDILSLQEKKKLLVGETDELQKRIDSFNAQKEDLKKKYNDMQRELENLTQHADSKTLQKLESEVKQLDEKNKGLNEQLTALQKEKNSKSSELSKANADVRNMGVYTSARTQQQYENNQDILKKKYSLISEEELSEIESTLGEFSKMADFATYEKRVKFARSCKNLYMDAQTALNSKFDDKKIISIRDRLIPVLNVKTDNISKGLFKLSEEQFSEFDKMDISLSRFKGGVREFQKLINAINSDNRIKKYRSTANDKSNRQACIDVLKEYVAPEAGSDRYNVQDRYFTVVPYLRTAFEKYKNELSKKTFSYTSIESEILSYNIK